VIWNPEKECIVQNENVLFRHKISPYIGLRLSGEVKETWIEGQMVFQNHLITKYKLGTWLKPL